MLVPLHLDIFSHNMDPKLLVRSIAEVGTKWCADVVIKLLLILADFINIVPSVLHG